MPTQRSTPITTTGSSRWRQPAAYAAEALLLLLALGLAALQIVLIVGYMDYEPERCDVTASTHHGITGIGVAVAAAALAAAVTSSWRMARRRPSVPWAAIAFFGIATFFVAWAFMTISATGC
jgi:hypothetical protein